MKTKLLTKIILFLLICINILCACSTWVEYERPAHKSTAELLPKEVALRYVQNIDAEFLSWGIKAKNYCKNDPIHYKGMYVRFKRARGFSEYQVEINLSYTKFNRRYDCGELNYFFDQYENAEKFYEALISLGARHK